MHRISVKRTTKGQMPSIDAEMLSNCLVTSSLSDSERFFFFSRLYFFFSCPTRRSGRWRDSGRMSGFPVSTVSRDNSTNFSFLLMLKNKNRKSRSVIGAQTIVHTEPYKCNMFAVASHTVRSNPIYCVTRSTHWTHHHGFINYMCIIYQFFIFFF